MSKNDFLFGLLILLILFASSHSFFGKNLPRFVWALSIIGSVLAGIALGLLIIDEFPANIFCGMALAISTVCLTLILRQTRKRHER
jgi:lipid-A-disaccharide synthase-like uncharacterized protein